MGWMPWDRLLLLVGQRYPLLGHKAAANSFKSSKILTINVTLDVSLDVPWRGLLTGSLLVKLAHIVGAASSSIHHALGFHWG